MSDHGVVASDAREITYLEAVREALTQFYELRETTGLKKKPSTSEVLDWLKLLMSESIFTTYRAN